MGFGGDACTSPVEKKGTLFTVFKFLPKNLPTTVITFYSISTGDTK